MISVQNVPDSSMRAFVGRSLGVVSPSLCEGFGFPVVEGQRYGVPVACADTPIYREVAGEGAEFFDPKDSRGLAMAVAGMLEAGRSRDLVEAGRENVERFTWTRAGEAHVALVERLKAKGERRK
jgi:glycosyltransferase involved in cell wall biosynthesis